MSDDELKAIRERAEKATPGPWDDSTWELEDGRVYFKLPSQGPQAIYDSDFASEARTDIPALLSEVERLRQAIRAAEDNILNHVAVILNWCDLALKAKSKSLMTAEENGARILLNQAIDAHGLRRQQDPRTGDLM